MGQHSNRNVLYEASQGVVTLLETEFCPYANLPTHTHEDPYFSFLLRGSYRENRPRSIPQEVVSGAVMYHPPLERHSDQFFGCGGRVLNVRLDRQWLNELVDGDRLRPYAHTFSGLGALRVGLQLRREFRHLSFDELVAFAADLISFAEIEQCLPLNQPPWMNHCINAIADAVDGGGPVAIRNMAARAGIHPVHLARSFRRFLGLTFSEYVLQVRLRCALHHLTTDCDKPVVDVAMECGFADHSHLCRTMRAVAGFTPTAFREQFRRHRQ